MIRIGKAFKTFAAGIVFALALLLSVFCVACSPDAQQPDPKPSPEPKPPVITPVTPEEVSLSKFIAEACSKTVPNFTLDCQIDADGEKTRIVTVRADKAISVEQGKEKLILSDGILYTQNVVEAEDGEKTVWTATEYEAADIALPSDLKTLLDTFFAAAGIDAKPRVTENGYCVEAQIDRADMLNDILEIAENNIDEPALVGAAALYNYFTKSSVTPSQLGAAIVLYGDTSFGSLLDMGIPMTRAEFWAFYTVLKSYFGEDSDFPEYADFMAAYEDKSLSEIIGRGSAEELVGTWETQTLRTRLSNYPYTEGTLADFVDASADTHVQSASMTLNLTSDPEFVLKTLKTTSRLQVENVPVFSESLESGGLKIEVKDIDSLTVVDGVFSSVGESTVQLPDDFAFVGEQKLTVTKSGEYGFLCGSENTPCEKINARIDSDEISDNGEWVNTLNRIIHGIEVDYEKHVLTVDADAYAAMLQAEQMGLTRLHLIAYNEFEFVVDIA